VEGATNNMESFQCGKCIPVLPSSRRKDPNTMQGNDKCSLLEHKERRGRMDTLDTHYVPGNPQDSVIYIHNKGSFHRKKKNTMLSIADERYFRMLVQVSGCT
jgi:hypothetical protein